MPSRAHTLAARAHALRSSVTLSEQRLWAELRASQLGVPFRRQVVLLNRFIADFYAPSAPLVVEVDGAYHKERRAADARRDQKLLRAGYQVLRLVHGRHAGAGGCVTFALQRGSQRPRAAATALHARLCSLVG